MVWGAITSSTKFYLVLIPPNKCTAKDFVEIIFELALEHYCYHHENYAYLILMEDGAPVHRSNALEFWREEIGLTKLNWLVNSLHLN
jgi:hypothetical protein